MKPKREHDKCDLQLLWAHSALFSRQIISTAKGLLNTFVKQLKLKHMKLPVLQEFENCLLYTCSHLEQVFQLLEIWPR